VADSATITEVFGRSPRKRGRKVELQSGAKTGWMGPGIGSGYLSIMPGGLMFAEM